MRWSWHYARNIRRRYLKSIRDYFLGGGAGIALTLLESHAKPSIRPSPVVAQLGTTYQSLSLSFESWSCSVTSWGVKAAMR